MKILELSAYKAEILNLIFKILLRLLIVLLWVVAIFELFFVVLVKIHSEIISFLQSLSLLTS